MRYALRHGRSTCSSRRGGSSGSRHNRPRPRRWPAIGQLELLTIHDSLRALSSHGLHGEKLLLRQLLRTTRGSGASETSAQRLWLTVDGWRKPSGIGRANLRRKLHRHGHLGWLWHGGRLSLLLLHLESESLGTSLRLCHLSLLQEHRLVVHLTEFLGCLRDASFEELVVRFVNIDDIFRGCKEGMPSVGTPNATMRTFLSPCFLFALSLLFPSRRIESRRDTSLTFFRDPSYLACFEDFGWTGVSSASLGSPAWASGGPAAATGAAAGADAAAEPVWAAVAIGIGADAAAGAGGPPVVGVGVGAIADDANSGCCCEEGPNFLSHRS